MARAVIALGGNVGDVRQRFRDALPIVCARAQAQLLARSPDYRTRAWGHVDQPDFINACALMTTPLAPQDFLRVLHDVEHEFGRNREQETRWGPRTLDLDLIAYDDVRINTPHLVLPHPRAKQRAFVLKPLAAIAPDLMLEGECVRDALMQLPPQEREEPIELPAIEPPTKSDCA